MLSNEEIDIIIKSYERELYNLDLMENEEPSIIIEKEKRVSEIIINLRFLIFKKMFG